MNEQPARICVVGSANIDLTFQTPRMPQPGETLAGDGFHIGFGGKGANQAVMAARLGACVSMIAKVGDDVFGPQYRANLQQQRVDVAHVSTAEQCPTGAAAIVVDRSAHNWIIVVPGANGRLTPADVRVAAPAIRAAAMVIGQCEVPIEATLEAFRIARQAGVKTLLNPAPAGELPEELLQLTEVLVANELEIAQIAERQFKTPLDSAAACLRLLQAGPRLVVVTLGERGALVFESGRFERVPSFPVQAVDTTGAGDAFVGSLAVFLVEGMPAADATRRANAAAALSVTKPGAQASYPSRAEVGFFALQEGDQICNESATEMT